MQPFPSLKNKTVLITGATSGLGKAAAFQLASLGADLFITGRDAQKCAQVRDQICSSSNNPAVDCLVADLSSQAEVRRMAQELRERRSRLDVLVNNAGAIFFGRHTSADGLEMTFALNHLAYFSLTLLLLDMLKASAPARIINVGSVAHIVARPVFRPQETTGRYVGSAMYARSKLANLYFTHELARRLAGSGVTVNALNPGFVATNFGRSNGGVYDRMFRVFQVFGSKTPEKAAATIIYLAADPGVEAITGKYFQGCRAVASSPLSHNSRIARQLWDLSLALSGLPDV